MKPESATVLSALRESSHGLLMITGDQMLTACHAAKELGLARKPMLLLQFAADEPAALASATAGGGYGGAASGGGGAERGLHWVWLEAQSGVARPPQQAELSSKAFSALAADFDLCVAGDVFAHLCELGQREVAPRQAMGSALPPLVPHMRVLARMAPEQKQTALAALRSRGVVTLMCGDGTNDVGALRQSDVSVALVSTTLVAPPPPTARGEAAGGGGDGTTAGLRQRKGKGGVKETQREATERRLEELKREMQQAPVVKLGDASIAAAFTARSASVVSCIDIISQGRCTLVTTVQMFKILACAPPPGGSDSFCARPSTRSPPDRMSPCHSCQPV